MRIRTSARKAGLETYEGDRNHGITDGFTVEELVVAVVSAEGVVSGSAVELVVAVSTGEFVVSGTALEDVVGVATDEGVVSVAADELQVLGDRDKLGNEAHVFAGFGTNDDLIIPIASFDPDSVQLCQGNVGDGVVVDIHAQEIAGVKGPVEADHVGSPGAADDEQIAFDANYGGVWGLPDDDSFHPWEWRNGGIQNLVEGGIKV